MNNSNLLIPFINGKIETSLIHVCDDANEANKIKKFFKLGNIDFVIVSVKKYDFEKDVIKCWEKKMVDSICKDITNSIKRRKDEAWYQSV